MVEKLKLSLQDLEVTSFDVTVQGRGSGTINAHDSGWEPSADCTQNPLNTECAVSGQYCSAAEPCWYTNPDFGNYGCGGDDTSTTVFTGCTGPHTCGGVCTSIC
jgi:hypothetical protein